MAVDAAERLDRIREQLDPRLADCSGAVREALLDAAA
jgi:hypothetical protein